jgi:deoxyadenosine/deoxycytidine kinase
MVLRMKKVVRRLSLRPDVLEPTGVDNEASWQQMLSRIDERDREIERRLAQAERALNKLNF